jgi:hypothetical protein
LLAFLLEIFFFIKAKNTLSVYRNHYDFRKSQPEPYLDAKYFSKIFIEEWKKHPGGYTEVPNTKIIIPNNFKGKYINVENNLRVTKFQPLQYKNTIHVFGGSTIFGGEVPDDNTIPSFLQKKINNSNRSYKVNNYGVSSIIAKYQFERLKNMVEIKKGDIVIFYGGANDVLQKIYFGNEEGWIVGGNEEKKLFWIKILRKISKNSYFFSYIDNKITATPPIQTNFANEAKVYSNEISIAKKYVEEKKGEFYHFLQPVLFEKENKNEYEKKLLTTKIIVPEGLENVFSKAYPLFKEQLKKNYSHDLTNSFNNTHKSVYLDWCHVNHIGNQIIAEKIFNIISLTN